MQLYGQKKYGFLLVIFLESGVFPAEMREWYCLRDVPKANVSVLCLKLQNDQS